MTYDEFISNIIETRGQWNIPKGEYKEKHHINPKCMGGSNYKENIIWLYAREHYIAHKLLAEENPDNFKLCSAYWRMTVSNTEQYGTRYITTPEEYEEAKLFWSKCMSNYMLENGDHVRAGLLNRTEEQKAITSEKLSKAGKGRKVSDTTRHNMSLSKLGDKNPMYNIGEGHPMYGKHHTEETKAKISRSRTGKCVGEDNPMYGKNAYAGKSEEELLEIAEKKRFKLLGGKHYKARKVKCVETGVIFEAINDAARWVGERTGSNIRRSALNGGRCRGYHWEFVEV